MAGLEVQIGADNAELEKKIADSEKLIKKLSDAKDARIKIGADTGDLDKKIDAATTKLNGFKKTADAAGASVNKFSRNTADGGNTLTQFSRIAQDAPFGIIGIGNNLTATAEAFGNLSKQAGGASGALKAVGASLAGSGGILLAISLVTTGLTYMSQQGLTVSDVFNKLSGTFDKARRDMQDLNAEAAKNAQAQISSVGAYVAAAKNINLSMSDRLIAVRKLQDEYPAYFGNLTKEQILNGNVASTVRDVTAALIAKAKAAGLTDRIVKLAEEEEKIQSSINNSIASQFKQYKLTKKEAFDAAVILNKQLRGQIDLEEKAGDNATKNLSKIEKIAFAAYNYSKTLQGLGDELRSNVYQQDRLTKSIEQQTAAQIKLDAVKDKAAKKTYDTPQVEGLDIAITQTGLDGLVELSGMLTQVSKNVQGRVGEIKTSLASIPYYFDTSGQAALLSLQKFNDNMNAIIQNGIVQTLSGLAEAIGEAFATGGNVVSAVGKSLLSTLGGVLTELGKMAITTGIGILAIKTSLQTLNPYVAIAAGAALIALGGAVKGSVKGLGGSMGSGGDGSTGTSYNTGASYSSPVSSSGGGGSSYSNSGTVVFEIAGDKLIGVLSNTVSKNNRLGGSLNL